MEERWTMMADLWSRLGGIAEKEGHRQAHISGATGRRAVVQPILSDCGATAIEWAPGSGQLVERGVTCCSFFFPPETDCPWAITQLSDFIATIPEDSHPFDPACWIRNYPVAECESFPSGILGFGFRTGLKKDTQSREGPVPRRRRLQPFDYAHDQARRSLQSEGR
ncbi:MAG: hypothetical protein BWY82_02232 [Verrucomicrobia bacterium ADurb.Bin474]|nr:MAG: hypothetical protein BWY82_02232 [Verrucomicrobia bacterium ADurb.Bin474]